MRKSAQNTNLSEPHILSLINNMVLISMRIPPYTQEIYGAFLPNNFINILRNAFLTTGLNEGKDFVFYKNNLYSSTDKIYNIIKYIYQESSLKPYFPDSKENLQNIMEKAVANPIWVVVDFDADVSDNYEYDLKEYMKEKKHRYNFDFRIISGVMYINKNAKGYEENGILIPQDYKSILKDFIEFLKSGGYIKSEKDLFISKTNLQINTQLYQPYNIILTAEQVKNNVPQKIIEEANSQSLSSNDIALIQGNEIYINTFSSKYNKIIQVLSKYIDLMATNKNMENDQSSKNSNKVWKLVHFKQSDISKPFNISDLVRELKIRFFYEGQDFMLIGNNFFINMMSKKIFSLERILAFLAARKIVISEFFINHDFGKRESKAVSVRWGGEVANTTLLDTSLLKTKSNYLFNINSIDSSEEKLIRIHFSEQCINSLLKLPLGYFYADYYGNIWYAKSDKDHFEKYFKGFEDLIKKTVSSLNGIKNKDQREAFVRKLIGDVEFSSVNPKIEISQDGELEIEKFWKSKDNPFRPIMPLTKEQLLRIQEYIDLAEDDEDMLFTNLSVDYKIELVREAIQEKEIFPGYTSRFTTIPAPYFGYKKDYLIQLANSRKISLHPGDIDIVKPFFYEYLLFKNQWNAEKIQAFFYELKFNHLVDMEKQIPTLTPQISLFRVAVEAFFYYILDGLKNHEIFAPIKNNEELTKERRVKYNKLISKIKSENVLARVLEACSNFYESKNWNIENINSLVQFRLNPIYKEILKIINTEISNII